MSFFSNNLFEGSPSRTSQESSSHYREILRLALPLVLSYFGLVLFEAAGTFWVGRYSSLALAAIGAAFFIEWILFSFMDISIVGCGTLVAQYVGSGQLKNQQRVINDAFWLSVFSSLVLMIFFFSYQDLIFQWMGLDLATLEFAQQYFSYFIAGIPLCYLSSLQSQIFNAHKDTFSNSIIIIAIIGINIVLDPLLIFGYAGFPPLGLKGLGLAGFFCRLLSVLAKSYFLHKRGYWKLNQIFRRPDFGHLRSLLAIGVPAAATNAIWNMVFPFLSKIVTQYGMAPLAALSVGQRFEAIPYFLSVGVSVAVMTLVAQSVGQGDHERARRISSDALRLISIALIPISILFVFFPTQLLSLLITDPEVLSHGAHYLRIVGYFELFLGWEILFEGAFNGFGRTQPYMWVRVPLTIARIPAALLLSDFFSLGVAGVWWAISLSTLFKGLGVAVLFQKIRFR